jgi:hypothetical protein
VARKVEVALVDDIDGSEAGEALAFSLDGRSYEIDAPRSGPTTCEPTSGRSSTRVLRDLIM